MKPRTLFFLVALLCAICASANTVSAQKDTTRTFPRQAIITTPLMSLIDDSKPSFYYRLYLINNESRVFALRLGTELLSSAENVFSTGVTDDYRSYNIKTGLEYGKRIRRSVIYIGGEYSFSQYKTNGAILYPLEGALFNLNNLTASQSVSRLDESTLKINSLIGFIGFKYELNKQLEVGIESGVGFGWYESELLYNDPSFVRSENYEGKLRQFTPNRFIFLGYNF